MHDPTDGLSLVPSEPPAESLQAVKTALTALEALLQPAPRSAPDLACMQLRQAMDRLEQDWKLQREDAEICRWSEERYHRLFEDSPVALWEEDCTEVLAELDRLRKSGVTDFTAYFSEHPETVAYCASLVRVVAVNQATLELYDARGQEEFKIGLNHLFSEESLLTFRDELVALTTGQRRFEAESINYTLSGRRLVIRLVCTLPSGKGKTPARMLVSIQDITERRRMVEALREEDRRKDEFLAMLAHELRNPLAPIRNAVHLLSLAENNQATQRRQREVIERQVTHMARLLDDLLDVARVTSGQITLTKQPLSLADVLNQALEIASPLMEARRLTLSYRLPPDDLCLEGDRDRLIQIFGNLLANAAKFTHEGGRIWLETERLNQEIVVRVCDNGNGILPELLPHVFDLFVQGQRTADRPHGGLGIGLTLVQRLAALHGGRVEAHSEGPGRGSKFVVILPAHAPVEPALTSKPKAPTDETLPTRVLVVDDNVDSAENLAEVLTWWGCETRISFNGPAALKIVRDFAPEVVLLDLGMPDMDGFEIARRLRREFAGRPLRLIALSGYGQNEDRRKSRESGFDDHLVKPVDLDALKKLLRP